MNIVTVSHLSKHFKLQNRREGVAGAFLDLFSRSHSIVKAVDDISMSIDRGEVVGFIGPNGAGKSTTIKMLTGVLEPTAGSVTVNGYVPYRERERYVRDIGVVIGQRSQLWWDIPVIESFRILREIYEVERMRFDANLQQFDELLGLRALFAVPVRKLSLGQRMLCDIAAAFLHDPDIIFLDEPSIGLDVAIKARVRATIRELNRTKHTTIIITSHDIGDIESLCRRVVLIDRGKILYDGDLARFNSLLGRRRTLRADLSELADQDESALVARVNECLGRADLPVRKDESGWIEITIDEDEIELLDVLQPLLKGMPVKDVKIEEVALESVIRRIYEGGLENRQ